VKRKRVLKGEGIKGKKKEPTTEKEKVLLQERGGRLNGVGLEKKEAINNVPK